MTKDEIYTNSLGDNKKCLHCGLHKTPEQHDGCIGELDPTLVMNACCGHGFTGEAYVQFWKDPDNPIRGEEALEYIKSNKSNR